MARSIILTVETEAAAATVYEALTTRDGLAGFWTPSVEATPEIGARLRFGFEAAPVELEMTVVTLEPGRRVEWRCEGPWPYWGGTRVEWTIDENRVAFAHRGWTEEQPEVELGSVAYTWALVLGSLKTYAETGVPAPALP